MNRALLSAGPSRRLFKLASPQHKIFYHIEQFTELRDVAARPRLRIAPEAVTEFIQRVEQYGQRVDSALDAKLDCRDPKDDYVLGLAVAGTAQIILTKHETPHLQLPVSDVSGAMHGGLSAMGDHGFPPWNIAGLAHEEPIGSLLRA